MFIQLLQLKAKKKCHLALWALHEMFRIVQEARRIVANELQQRSENLLKA